MNDIIEAEAPLPIAQEGLSPFAQAIDRSTLNQLAGNPETLRELLKVQREWEDDQARKAYYKALSKFRKHDLVIDKDRKVSYRTDKGPVEYRHSSLGAVMSTINPLLAKCGLNLSWETKQDNGLITVTAYLSHELGHREKNSLSASPDASGRKNAIQAVGSAVTYLQRYTAFALLGLASADQDDDGVKTGDPIDTISEEQVNTLHAKVIDNNIDMQAFMRWVRGHCKVNSLEDLNERGFQEAMAEVNKAITRRST